MNLAGRYIMFAEKRQIDKISGIVFRHLCRTRSDK